MKYTVNKFKKKINYFAIFRTTTNEKHEPFIHYEHEYYTCFK